MFFIGKAANFILLPPGVLFLCSCTGILLILLKKTRAGIIIIAAGAYLLYILSTEVVFDRLMLPLENEYSRLQSGAPADNLSAEPLSIVVLGGGVIDSAPSPDSLNRLLYASELYGDLHIPIVVSGGNVYDLPGMKPEAVVDAKFLEKLGVEPGFIIIEAESKTTWENAAMVKALNVPQPILLVTSAYHMPRAVFCFETMGLDVIPAPTDFKTQRIPYTLLSYLPDMSALYGGYKALKEYLGLAFYKLRK